MLWNIFMLLDFPLGWLVIPIELYGMPLLRTVVASPATCTAIHHVYLPTISFGLLGGTQYYLLTFLVVRVFRRLRRRGNKGDKSEWG